MESLKEKMRAGGQFLCGIELVSTRGTMEDNSALKVRKFGDDLANCPWVDWVSITDNAGGNPMMGPMALGKTILYTGKEVMIHLSCKDFNRNGLEREAWQLASEGFHNLLALSGDSPNAGHEGRAKPVFDIDSIGLLCLLRAMNLGLAVRSKGTEGPSRQLSKTQFMTGAVTTNFKRLESEVIPQYLKLEQKIACGARFIISQIGFDARKSHELLLYLNRRGLGVVPLIGNVYLLSPRVTEYFYQGEIPGVVLSDGLMEVCRRQARSADKGRAFFLELAAKQCAIYRGLGYQGVYVGGVHTQNDLERISALQRSWAADDWKMFAKEVRFSRPGEFYLLDEDPETRLAADRLNPEYARALRSRRESGLQPVYRFSKWMHHALFTPGAGLHGLGAAIYRNAADPRQGPKFLRMLEHFSKAALFKCRDCGDCSLPDIAYLCPESACAKNQRNGPCGGTRDGKCEVADFECIWCRAYDRRKAENAELELLAHVPVIQDQGLRGTSSWANTYLRRDYHARRQASSRRSDSTAGPVTPDGERQSCEPSSKDSSLYSSAGVAAPVLRHVQST